MTILEAVEEDDVEGLKRLLNEGLSPEGDDDDTSPLLQALFRRSEVMVRVLLEAGADPNSAPKGHFSPLSIAPTAGLTELLVEAGARVGLETGHDMLGQPGWSLHGAAGDGDAERLRVLLEQAGGMDYLEAYDSFGHTPVGTAAWGGRAEALDVLLQKGADPNNCDPDHIAYSPLELAASPVRGGDALECVRLLLEHGADPDHAWGLCSTGRETITRVGGRMLEMLEEADRHLERRRLTAESVRMRLVCEMGTRSVPDQTPSVIRGRTIWVFGSLSGPSLIWNWKWGVLRADGKIRWYQDYKTASAHL